MARQFDNAAFQYLEVVAAPVATPAFTMACWFNSDDVVNDQVMLAVANSGSGTNYHALGAFGSVGGDPVVAMSRNANVFASSTAGYGANAWHHACGVWAANNDRRAYIDGTNRGNEGTVSNDAGIDTTSIGRIGDSSPSDYMSGAIAEAAIWNVALDDDDVAALARGVSPRLMRPGSLVAYWPLWGLHSPEIDCATGAYPMTLNNGPTQANHAPVVPFMGEMWPATVLPVEVVGVAVPVLSGDEIHGLVFGGVTVR